ELLLKHLCRRIESVGQVDGDAVASVGAQDQRLDRHAGLQSALTVQVLAADIQYSVFIAKRWPATVEHDLSPRRIGRGHRTDIREGFLCGDRGDVKGALNGWRGQNSWTRRKRNVSTGPDGIVRQWLQPVRDGGGVVSAEQTPHAIRKTSFIQTR